MVLVGFGPWRYAIIPYRTQIWLGAEKFVRQKILTAKNFFEKLTQCTLAYHRPSGQKCRNFVLVPKIVSAESFCPPKLCPLKVFVRQGTLQIFPGHISLLAGCTCLGHLFHVIFTNYLKPFFYYVITNISF